MASSSISTAQDEGSTHKKNKKKKKKQSLLTRLGMTLGLIRHKAAIIVIGLDNSGKTTLLKRLQAGVIGKTTALSTETVPTIGFSAESFRAGNVEFACFDMAGQEKYRSLWERYYCDVEAVIFVCDAADRIRLCIARDELDTMLAHPDIASKSQLPILFFANKMDLLDAMEPADVMISLGLERIEDKPWHICACSATTGTGVQSGIEWLTDCIKGKFK